VTARRVELHPPVVRAGTAVFRWTVEPPSPLYRRSSFTLAFPPEVDLGRVPETLWWTAALLCLSAQWPFLGPCVVVLPVRLPPGEAEFWGRLLEAQVTALAARARSRAASTWPRTAPGWSP
jgi:hypothetical protein